MTNDVVNVLNSGYVRLVEHMGNDLSIVRSARVSYNADWRTGEDEGKDEKLIRYLMKNHHTSPFESVMFTFEVKAPIFVFRQWHRHRTWSINERSARYSQLDEGFYVPFPENVGIQSTNDKQAREVGSDASPKDFAAAEAIRQSCAAAEMVYKKLLESGVPRELARSVLPVAAYSRMFATIDLHNLMQFFELRLSSHAQYEIRVYAQAMLTLVEPIVPVAIAAFKEYNLPSCT